MISKLFFSDKYTFSGIKLLMPISVVIGVIIGSKISIVIYV